MANEGLTLVRDRWYTALTADVTSAATSLPVVTNTVNGSVLPTPCIIMCGFEQMYATASTATTITVTRGFNSTAAAHAKGSTVGIARVAAHHNDMVTALVALGATSSPTFGYSASLTQTTSTSFVDTPDLTLASMTTMGGKIFILVSAMATHSGVGGAIVMQLLDNGVGTSHSAEVNPAVIGARSAIVLAVVIQPAAGAHVFKVQWLTGSGTASLYTRSITAIEIGT